MATGRSLGLLCSVIVLHCVSILALQRPSAPRGVLFVVSAPTAPKFFGYSCAVPEMLGRSAALRANDAQDIGRRKSEDPLRGSSGCNCRRLSLLSLLPQKSQDLGLCDQEMTKFPTCLHLVSVDCASDRCRTHADECRGLLNGECELLSSCRCVDVIHAVVCLVRWLWLPHRLGFCSAQARVD